MNQNTLEQGNDVLQYIFKTYFNWHAIISFLICIAVALLLGRIIAAILRQVTLRIGNRADRSQDLKEVNRYRRYETYLVLSIAVIRVLLVLFALYFWWLLDHPDTQPTALIGASALLVLVFGASAAPLIRDITAGASMMVEQWYGVGDYVKVEPFMDMQGVVERVTLRSTRIRTLTGEVVWVNNQNIQGVRITPKGLRTMALDLFVTDREAGEKLVDQANDRLPIGSLLLATPLYISDELRVGKNLWHITVLGETAPGREWLIEKAAVDLIKELDEASKTPVIAHGPLARFADSEAEKKFKRTITNARKKPGPKKRVLKKPTTKKTS
jgi:moderate conductance mechanosensitive channel